MVEVYFYLPAQEVENAVECGLKLSKWYDKEVHIGLENKKCMSALLNPKDDMKKYKDESLQCVKLELYPRYCYVADRYLYEMGLTHPEIMDLYKDSVMPIEQYTFGLYRLPECLVTSTIIGEQVSLLDRGLGSPVLFDKSEELYINNIIEDYKETYEDFNDVLLYYFYCNLEKLGKLTRIEDDDKEFVVFLDKNIGRAFTIKKPGISW
ncbi:MAG: hypothetical protein GX660_09385 [Clostridiaceae bacterium]|nr:hypothetical protein [Clostridiaceae bacterium]